MTRAARLLRRLAKERDGQTLRPIMVLLNEWGEEYLKRIEER